ncbi:C39 family peptidase [Desulfococcaceae bacterium HSG8]|nr:C39 family peptidase [Desulfococcaceae bacterium HSG8]
MKTVVKSVIFVTVLFLAVNAFAGDYEYSFTYGSQSAIGEGTWGSILEMTVRINGDNTVTATIEKKDGSTFRDGYMYLQKDSYGESLSYNIASTSYNGGYSVTLTSESPLDNMNASWSGDKMKLYARAEFGGDGYAWVGPVRITRSLITEPVSVTLDAPHSGTYEHGDSIAIRWNTSGADSGDPMTVSMKRDSYTSLSNPDNVNWYRFPDYISNDGSYSATIPSSAASASDWKFYVSHNDSGEYDQSDYNITISSPDEPPTVEITNCPGTLTSSSYTFEWEGDDDDGYVSGYYCDMDDSTPDFHTTGTSKSYSDLSSGRHTFYVKAKDDDGLHSAVISCSFSVDVPPPPTPTEPTVRIMNCPSEPLTSSAYTFSWSGNDSDGHITTYYYGLDDPSPDNSTSSMSKNYSDLGNGSHVFYVKARDNDGLYSPVASCDFDVDVESPGPENLNIPFISQVPPGDWNNTKNCGQTCCAMIFAYYNGTVPTEQDIKKIDDWMYENYGDSVNNYNGSYTTVDKLAKLAKDYGGFQNSEARRQWNMSDLQNELDNDHPVIVAIRLNMETTGIGHFMVLRGMDDNYVYVNDPGKSLASGHGKNKRYTRTEFSDSWNTQNKACVTIHRADSPSDTVWNGTGSIISQGTEDNECWGCNKDEARVHPSSSNPFVTFQWQVSPRCRALKLESSLNDSADIRIGSWHDRSSDLMFSGVQLPFILDQSNLNGLSFEDGAYFTMKVGFNSPVDSSVSVFAWCTDESGTNATPASADASTGGWHGNASIISSDSKPYECWGCDKDEARVHPGEDQPEVYFQWQGSDRCGSLTISCGNDPCDQNENPEVEIFIKPWEYDEDKDCTSSVCNTVTTRLPYTFDSAYAPSDGNYKVIRVRFLNPVSETKSVIARCPGAWDSECR